MNCVRIVPTLDITLMDGSLDVGNCLPVPMVSYANFVSSFSVGMDVDNGQTDPLADRCTGFTLCNRCRVITLHAS